MTTAEIATRLQAIMAEVEELTCDVACEDDVTVFTIEATLYGIKADIARVLRFAQAIPAPVAAIEEAAHAAQ